MCTFCATILEDDLKLPVSTIEKSELLERFEIDNETAYRLGVENSLHMKRVRSFKWLEERYIERRKNKKCIQSIVQYKTLQKQLSMPFHPVYDI